VSSRRRATRHGIIRPKGSDHRTVDEYAFGAAALAFAEAALRWDRNGGWNGAFQGSKKVTRRKKGDLRPNIKDVA
jgi:hypothetical protein